MTSGYPEITEQDPLVPCSLGQRERLAKFVANWGQRRHVVETRRRIDKRFADASDWVVRKALNS